MTGKRGYQVRDLVLYHIGGDYQPFVGVVLMTPDDADYMWVKFWNLASSAYETIEMKYNSSHMWNIGRLPDFAEPDNRWATSELPT
jgi:hypothetical protein